MNQYSEFVENLKTELKTFFSNPKELWKATATKYVDGYASDELRRLIDLETRRSSGAFFTDSRLAKKVLESLKPIISSNSFIYDPACGAGNLLIAAFDYLKRLKINLNWEKNLLGTDVHQEFVEAARLRLIMNVLLKQKEPLLTFEDKSEKNTSIICADSLLSNEFYEKATHIIVNPPFNQITIDETLSWSKGKVSAAALFVDKIISYTNPGTSIIAILPDVLRSGSRYEKWRTMVQKECIIEKTKLLGQFDKHADVDVYAVYLTKRKNKVFKNFNSTSLEAKISKKARTLQDFFQVCVGPVVDNRDPNDGPLYSYIISRGLEGWTIKKEANLKRRHLGKTFEGPFVVVKRTSRMTDKKRAIASIINIIEPVYVDNHLIILKPKSGKFTDCQKALQVLNDTRTDNWLNHEIRCRHLTVRAISNIPIWQ